MRRIISMLMEIAQANNPQNHAKYSEAYPLIDASLNVLTGGDNGSLTANKLSETMVAADFPYALGEFVDRALWPAYGRWEFGFQPLVWNDTTPNFMDITRYQRQQGINDLEMVREKARPKAGSYPRPRKLQYRVYRWEKQYDFSMEALVNDDLGYFNDMAGLMGDSARRTLERFVSRLYHNATTIAAMVALGANYSGTARLSTNALMTAWAAFNNRVDAAAVPMNIRPVILVIHKALEPVALQIIRSVQVAENATNALNVLPPLQLIIDPYITGTAPNYPWWLFTTPNTGGIRTITLARMQGRPGPLVLQKAPDTMTFSGFNRTGALVPGIGDFDTGNIMLKVADIWGGWDDATYAGLTDYRGAYYSSGTTG